MAYNSKYTGAEVDAALDLAKTALQEHQDLTGYAKTEDIPKKVSELENDAQYITNEDISGKQDKALKFSDSEASVWVSDNTYTEYPYRCDVTCEGVTGESYAEVVFSFEQAMSGKYAPICETRTDVVSIWSSDNTAIIIPTILITL